MKKYWWLIVIVLIFPIMLNLALRLSSPFPVIGDEKLWLSILVNYGGALIGSFITLFVLYKTLSQNERNNNETKALQVNILKIQLRQKWLDNLVETLKQNISYIKISELNDAVLNLSTDIERTEIFFHKEISISISKPIELTLHFIGSMDNELEENQESIYLKLFKEISSEYGTFLLLGLRITLLIKYSDSIEHVTNLLEKTINSDNILKDDEVRTLRNAQTIVDFIIELHKIIHYRFIEFTHFYENKQLQLIQATQDLVTYETNKMMINIK